MTPAGWLNPNAEPSTGKIGNANCATCATASEAKDGSYDCLVPGSGGKDSLYASHILKTQYGMHPLTVTWAPHIYTEWGWRNFQRWIHAGHDNYLMTPNGRVQSSAGREYVNGVPVAGAGDALPAGCLRDLADPRPPEWFRVYVQCDERQFNQYLQDRESR